MARLTDRFGFSTENYDTLFVFATRRASLTGFGQSRRRGTHDLGARKSLPREPSFLASIPAGFHMQGCCVEGTQTRGRQISRQISTELNGTRR